MQQTWYAAGVGIVRRTTAVPSDVRGDTVTDEWLVSWDGIGTGLGARGRQRIAAAGLQAGEGQALAAVDQARQQRRALRFIASTRHQAACRV